MILNHIADRFEPVQLQTVKAYLDITGEMRLKAKDSRGVESYNITQTAFRTIKNARHVPEKTIGI